MEDTTSAWQRAKLLRQQPIPADLLGLLVGTILGDGSLAYQRNIQNENGVWLSINHCEHQLPYVILKRKLFDSLCVSGVKRSECNHSYYFTTVCHPELAELRRKMYTEKRKAISKQVLDLLTIAGFAFWFFDDGSCSVRADKPSAYTYFLTLACFTLEECKLIRMWLFKKLKLKTTILKDPCKSRNKFYYKLYFARETVPTLESYLTTYMVPGMGYKLQPGIRSPETACQAPFWDTFLERMKIQSEHTGDSMRAAEMTAPLQK